MYIEDAELRDIYKAATTERLQSLEASLLHLEKNPSDRDRLEAFLREAHTLKGDSRMLGVKDVETLIHQMEDLMAAVKRGESVISSELCDRLYRGIDAIRKLVREAVTGVSSGVNTFLVLAELMGAQSNTITPEVAPTPTQTNANGHENLSDDFLFADFAAVISNQTEIPSSEQPTAIKEEPVESEPILTAESIDTIRVEASKLDALMRQAGELSIANLRIARRTSDLEEILRLYEEWSRDTSVNRSVLRQLDPKFKQVQDYWKRAETRLEKLGNLVSSLKAAASEDSASLESISNNLESGIQNLRLLPLATVFNLFPRMVRDLARHVGKPVKLELEGGETRVDKRIIEEIKDPLLHIIRNAIDHGIETPEERQSKGKPSRAIIRLKGYQRGDSIIIEVIDDGRGLDLEAIKKTALGRGIIQEEELASLSTEQIKALIFTPGFSTRSEVTEISGRGIGLDVVRTNVERLKGRIEVESVPTEGCEFRIHLNTNLSTTHVLIAQVNQNSYAIPVESVETMLLLSRQEIFSIEGSGTITFEGQPVSVVWLADLLELPVSTPASPQSANTAARNLSCIILKIGTERLGVLVDALLDRQDIFLKPQSKLLKRIRNISGATILGNGEVCMVVNPQDLLKSIHKGSRTVAHSVVEEVKIKDKILLVEDSIIIRTQMKRLLEGAGYDVAIAVDGSEGFNKLRTGNYDAVVSDVEMPNLNGLQLTAKIRQHREYSEVPIILVTTLASAEDKRRGAEAGANAYLTKGDFDQKVLIETLKRLI
ncbi:MAG: hybrid sensor histidine kinase/response regulator [Hydrococcus sp. Prado102]|jgi:two-component system chemotaxis sensor kinase CheA|nr:hybrid sensor histidine kinase/response regulator [Hydrococcus sp. Prado102]